MMEEAHRRVMKIANEKIKVQSTFIPHIFPAEPGANSTQSQAFETDDKEFEGGRGHQVKMDDSVKNEIKRFAS